MLLIFASRFWIRLSLSALILPRNGGQTNIWLLGKSIVLECGRLQQSFWQLCRIQLRSGCWRQQQCTQRSCTRTERGELFDKTAGPVHFWHDFDIFRWWYFLEMHEVEPCNCAKGRFVPSTESPRESGKRSWKSGLWAVGYGWLSIDIYSL